MLTRSDVSRSLFIGETDIQMYKAHSLYRLKGRQIRMPDLLLASKWLQLLDPLLAFPCMLDPRSLYHVATILTIRSLR